MNKRFVILFTVFALMTMQTVYAIVPESIKDNKVYTLEATPVKAVDCKVCDNLLKDMQESVKKMKKALSDVDMVKSELDKFYHKLFRLLKDNNVDLQSLIENAGGVTGKMCAKPSLEDDQEEAALPFNIGGVKFCVTDETAYDSFVDKLLTGITIDAGDLLDKIKELHPKLKEEIKALRGLERGLREIHEKTRKCKERLQKDCPLLKTRIKKDFIRPEERPKDEMQPREPEDGEIAVLLKWGYLTKAPEVVEPLKWLGSISMDSGYIKILKTVLFEDKDRLLEQSDYNVLDFESVTNGHFDGLMISFKTSDEASDPSVLINIGDFSEKYTLEELSKAREVHDLDNGRQVSVTTVYKGMDIGDKPNQMLDFKGRLLDKVSALKEKLGNNVSNEVNEALDNLMNYNFTDDVEGELVKLLGELGGDPQRGIKNFGGAIGELKKRMLPKKFEAGMIPFEDVDDDAWFFEYVKFMKDNGIASGYAGTNNFGPGNPVTRAEVMKMAMEASGEMIDDPGENAEFLDIRGHWGKKYIQHAYKNGFVKGFDDGFRPDQKVTRAEALKIVGMVLGLPMPECSESEFPDMQDHWAKCIVQVAKDYGIVDGMPDGGFHPDEPITRAAFSKILKNIIEVLREEEYQGLDSNLVEEYL